MSNLANAYVLAGLIYADDQELTSEERSENLYNCVEAMGFGSDERKADLYAQLEEKLYRCIDMGFPFESAVKVIKESMDNTDKRHPHG